MTLIFITTITSLPLLFGAYIFLKKINNIEEIKTIEHAITFLQNLSVNKSTENITDSIIEHLEKSPLSDETISRISKLHYEYGDDKGIKGYAINMLWSCILSYHISKCSQNSRIETSH